MTKPRTDRPSPAAPITVPPELLELTELLAENVHDAWARQRRADGWRYGPARNDTLKEHPCLVAYDELPESEKEYDRKTALETIRVILSFGYRIEPPAGNGPEPAPAAMPEPSRTQRIRTSGARGPGGRPRGH